MTNPIICLKFFNGEEIIATVERFDGDVDAPQADELFGADYPWAVPNGLFKLKDALSVTLSETGAGAMALGMVPWMYCDFETETVIDFGKHVLAVFRPNAQIEKNYLQQTSGIALAGAAGSDRMGSKLKM